MCLMALNKVSIEFYSDTGIRMLSLDGGGSRGLVVAHIIANLEEKLNNPEFHSGEPVEKVQLWQLFDLIIGTRLILIR